MSRVLVAYAGRRGSTGAIANLVAAQVRGYGHRAQVRRVEDEGDLEGFDAYVVGSDLPHGRWDRRARTLLKSLADRPNARALWAFCGRPQLTDPEGPPQREDSNATRPLAKGGADGLEAELFDDRLPPIDLEAPAAELAEQSTARSRDLRSRVAVRGWARTIALELLRQEVDRTTAQRGSTSPA